MPRNGRKPESFYAESDEQPHIALDLACGLFDLKSKEAAERAELLMNGAQSYQGEGDDSASTSSSDSDSSESPKSSAADSDGNAKGVIAMSRRKQDGTRERKPDPSRRENAATKRQRTKKIQEL